MLIRDVMTRDVETISPDESLVEAASAMRDLNAGVLPVADGSKLLGMLTDRDITVRSTAKGADPKRAKVRDAMSAAVISCFEDQDVQEVATIMRSQQVRRLIVLDRSGQIAGIVSLGDIAISTADEKLSGGALRRISEPPVREFALAGDTDQRTSDGQEAQPERRDRDEMEEDTRVVAGLFSDWFQAERAAEDLRRAGLDPGRVSVITKDPRHAPGIAPDTGAKVAGGTVAGAGLGAIFGGAAGWLVGIGALAVPGIGPIIAAGPIAVALGVAGATAAAAAGVGAVTGGVVGALSGWGFSESEAREYETRISRGEILLAAEVEDETAEMAERVLRQDGAVHVSNKLAA